MCGLTVVALSRNNEQTGASYHNFPLADNTELLIGSINAGRLSVPIIR